MRAPRPRKTRVAGCLSVSQLLDLHPDPLGIGPAGAARGSDAPPIAHPGRSNAAELDPLAEAGADGARCALSLHGAGIPEAFPLRRDVEKNAITRESRHDLEAGGGVLHRRPRLACADEGAAAFHDLHALIDAFVERAARPLRAHIELACAVADPAARFQPFPRCLANLVEAHGDLQAPQRTVDRLERAANIGDIRRARPQEELSLLPGQRAAGLQQRPERREHLLYGGMLERNDLERILREAVS